MADMVEKVARAICRADGVDPDAIGYGLGVQMPKDAEYPLWKAREAQARAAIEAMRTPTEAMRRAGTAAMPVCFDEEAGAISCWQAMIDAILKEEGNG